MAVEISNLSIVDPRARVADDVVIGPFCVVGPHVQIGEGTVLDSHVTLSGHTSVGKFNRFFPNCVIGEGPQDKSYCESDTRVEIGDDNVFREGVTVNRGAEKEDGCTRIGNRNLLMANSHVAHNCYVYNDTILVNGVLLGGHVHVHDGAIVSGNSVVHHFSTLGRLSFVSGGCRVPHDIPPFMLAAGSDNPTIKTINIVGMRRAEIPETSIRLIKKAHRYLFRDLKPVATIRQIFEDEVGGELPVELESLISAVEAQSRGKMGRAREAFRAQPPAEQSDDQGKSNQEAPTVEQTPIDEKRKAA
ncbi:MAG: acyl-[acyl-carrier-protein]--UDP-N-acetylglucosamine O-acyltransferase [Planctomycetaceae bacterium]|nr:acyl-[acyl-carrier-protein]--UDP-N-acetylglucosamine O-acyltransferase [Planctomycetaceae bacterium]